MYSPREATAAGFLDLVVPADELHAVAVEAATGLATLDATAHAATKLRARGATLKAMRAAIETEITTDNFSAGH